MGRYSYTDRLTVSHCKYVSIKTLKRLGFLKGGYVHGNLSWTRNGEPNGNLDVTVLTQDYDGYIHFCYTSTDRRTREVNRLDYKAALVWTPCNYGGRRWWMICPLTVNSNACCRRVTALYLAHSKYFGCRHCHNLTYRSCQESHCDDRVFHMLGVSPKEGRAMWEHLETNKNRGKHH